MCRVEAPLARTHTHAPVSETSRWPPVKSTEVNDRDKFATGKECTPCDDIH